MANPYLSFLDSLGGGHTSSTSSLKKLASSSRPPKESIPRPTAATSPSSSSAAKREHHGASGGSSRHGHGHGHSSTSSNSHDRGRNGTEKQKSRELASGSHQQRPKSISNAQDRAGSSSSISHRRHHSDDDNDDSDQDYYRRREERHRRHGGNSSGTTSKAHGTSSTSSSRQHSRTNSLSTSLTDNRHSSVAKSATNGEGAGERRGHDHTPSSSSSSRDIYHHHRSDRSAQASSSSPSSASSASVPKEKNSSMAAIKEERTSLAPSTAGRATQDSVKEKEAMATASVISKRKERTPSPEPGRSYSLATAAATKRRHFHDAPPEYHSSSSSSLSTPTSSPPATPPRLSSPLSSGHGHQHHQHQHRQHHHHPLQNGSNANGSATTSTTPSPSKQELTPIKKRRLDGLLSPDSIDFTRSPPAPLVLGRKEDEELSMGASTDNNAMYATRNLDISNIRQDDFTLSSPVSSMTTSFQEKAALVSSTVEAPSTSPERKNGVSKHQNEQHASPAAQVSMVDQNRKRELDLELELFGSTDDDDDGDEDMDSMTDTNDEDLLLRRPASTKNNKDSGMSNGHGSDRGYLGSSKLSTSTASSVSPPSSPSSYTSPLGSIRPIIVLKPGMTPKSSMVPPGATLKSRTKVQNPKRRSVDETAGSARTTSSKSKTATTSSTSTSTAIKKKPASSSSSGTRLSQGQKSSNTKTTATNGSGNGDGIHAKDSGQSTPTDSLNEGPAAPRRNSILHSDQIVAAAVNRYKNHFLTVIEDSDSTVASNPSSTAADSIHVALEYPGAGAREKFTLMKPFLNRSKTESDDKDEYNPIEDLVITVKTLAGFFFAKEEYETLFGTATEGLIRNLTKFRNRKDGIQFVKTVEDFNEIMKSQKLSGQLEKFVQGYDGMIPYEVVVHVLQQVYSRTVASRASKLNQYEAFSNNVYGEILPILTKEFIQNTKLDKTKVFVDLGCGIGNVVLQVALQVGAESYGIEIMDIPARFAKKQAREFEARTAAYGLDHGKVTMLQGDFLDTPELAGILSRADVVLVNNYAFNSDLNQSLLQLFLDLKDGCKVISLKTFVALDHKINVRNAGSVESILRVKKYPYWTNAVSWTHNGGEYFIATVDRTAVKAFWERAAQGLENLDEGSGTSRSRSSRTRNAW